MKANLQSESLVGVRIDNYSPKGIAFLVCSFVVGIIGSIIGGSHHIAPDIFWTAHSSAFMECHSYDCVPTFHGALTNMKKMHQSLIFEFEMQKPCQDRLCDGHACSEEEQTIDGVHFWHSIEAVQNQTGPTNHTQFFCGEKTKSTSLEFDMEYSITAWGTNNDGSRNMLATDSKRTRTVTCPSGQFDCDAVIIFVENYLYYDTYHTDVSFTHPYYGYIEDASKNTGISVEYCLDESECFEYLQRIAFTADTLIGKIIGVFKMKYVDKQFTMYEFGWKYGMLAISMVVFGTYMWALSKTAPKYRSYEQYWLAVLLFLLLFFNDPLFVLEIFTPGPFWSGLYVVTMTLYLAALLLFWLCVLDIVRSKAYWQEEARKLGWQFYLPKLVLVALIWTLTISVYFWVRAQNYNDPTYSSPSDFSNYRIVKAAALVFMLVYTLWAIVLAAIACYVCVSAGETPKRPFLFLFCVSFCTLLVTAIGAAIGGFTPRPVYTIEFTLFFSILNMYLWLMAFAYTPAASAASSNSAGDDASSDGGSATLQMQPVVAKIEARPVAPARPSFDTEDPRSSSRNEDELNL